MSQQLVKKGTNGKHENVMPKSWIEAIKDKNTGQTLVEILQGFNMYFLPYNGNTSATRCLVSTILRKKGLWITYVKYDGNVYTEWYAADEIDDTSWGDSSNWRVGNNTLVGDITISANGNWVINGTETEFKAIGEKGNTPLLRVANNRLQVSYDLGDTYRDVTNNPVYTKFRWLATSGDTQANNVGRIQASTDEGKTWTNMSNDFTNNLHISRYIGVSESLPTSGIAEGTIYAKGPTYTDEDISHSNPIYRLWVYSWKGNTLAWQDNGEFTSISAGIVQELGNSETEVMSQKSTTKEITILNSKVSKIQNDEYSISDFTDNFMIDKEGNIVPNDYYRVIKRIPVSEGDTINTNGVVSDNPNVCCIAAYDSYGSFIESKSIFTQYHDKNYNYVVDSGIAYIAVSTLLTKTDIRIIINRSNSLESLREDINTIQSNLDFLQKAQNDTYTVEDFEDGFMIDIDGNIIPDNIYCRVLRMLPVNKGDIIHTLGVKSDISTSCCIAAYNKENVFLSDKSVFIQNSDNYYYEVVDDVAYLSFSTLLTIDKVAVSRVTSLDNIVNGCKKLNSEDFIVNNTFIETTGKEVYNSEYITTDFIPIVGIKMLLVKAAMGNIYGGGIAFYTKSKEFISSLYGMTSKEVSMYSVTLSDIPSDAWYIKVQGRKGKDLYVYYKNTPTSELNSILSYNKSQIWNRKKHIYSDSSEQLSTDEYLIIEDSPNIRNSYVIQASAIVRTMGRLRISKGTGAYAAGIIDIDANNIFEYNPNNPTAYNTYEHGLAISDFIRVTILVSDAPMTATITGKAKMIVESVGGRYEKDIMWNGGNNNIVFLNTSANLTNAEITLSIKGKDVWYFGDSYLDFWTPYAYKLGGSNILIDGYSGRASEAAYISLLREILTNLPKKIVWGMGMNDGDNTDSVNSNWNYYYEQVMAFCNEYGIELILVTIPNTPTVNNFYKNQIIRESGCRYLDVAKLMGAENKSSSWYSGLMSSDNVHPTDLGAKILATYIVSQLAEIVE